MSQFNRESPINPYASPLRAAPSVADTKLNEAESIRHQMLKHEASIRSIGALYILGAILNLFMAIAFIGMSLFEPRQIDGLGLIVGGVASLIGALYFYLGRGLRRLDPKVKGVAILLSVLGLIGFPLGTLISCYTLYLLCSEKGTYVFSEGYARVREATPHIVYKSSLILLFFVALLVIVFVGMIISLALGG